MLSTFRKILRYVLINWVGQERVKTIVSGVATTAGINLLSLAYQKQGISEHDFEINGEKFLIKYILPSYIIKQEKIVLFDVGANIGNYALYLANEFPEASVYAFEPNQNTFLQLQSKVAAVKNIIPINEGLGAEIKESYMYTYASDLSSEHATLYREVLTDIHQSRNAIELNFRLNTIINFCQEHKIRKIHFLKIDVEGYEIEVLKGAKNMLDSDLIDIIQFEFTQANVISRIFMKDFYDLLSSYHIYRIDSKKLIPLFKYHYSQEIFIYQNFVAFHRSLPLYNPLKK